MLSFAALFFPVAKVTGFGDLGGIEFSARIFGRHGGACFHRVRVGCLRVAHRLLAALCGCCRGSGFFGGLGSRFGSRFRGFGGSGLCGKKCRAGDVVELDGQTVEVGQGQ